MDDLRRLTNALTKAEVRQLAVKTVTLGTPRSFTAGEVTTALQKAGYPQMVRAAVDRALKEARALGEVMVELKPVVRNGITIPNAAHYYAPRQSQGEIAGCGNCPDCQDRRPCSVMAAFKEAEGLVTRR